MDQIASVVVFKKVDSEVVNLLVKVVTIVITVITTMATTITIKVVIIVHHHLILIPKVYAKIT